MRRYLMGAMALSLAAGSALAAPAEYYPPANPKVPIRRPSGLAIC